MRKGFRVLITERCNMRCPSCFNRDVRRDLEMSFFDFCQLCAYLKDEGGISRLKIMGGEPTIHPEFNRLLMHAQDCFQSVHVFTNGVNDVIGNIHMRKDDTVIYNLSCMGDNYPAAKLLPNENFVHAYETRVDSSNCASRIKRVLAHVYSIVGPSMVINLTLDCTEDIFANKVKIVANWNEIVDYIENELGISYKVDHAIPYCFFMGSDMKVKLKGSFCPLKCAGLITPDLFLRHCNQTSENLIRIRQNGRFISWQILEQHLQCEHYKMAYDALNKVCKNCLLYGKKCDGGCFVFKKGILRDSILNTTGFQLQ